MVGPVYTDHKLGPYINYDPFTSAAGAMIGAACSCGTPVVSLLSIGTPFPRAKTALPPVVSGGTKQYLRVATKSLGFRFRV